MSSERVIRQFESFNIKLDEIIGEAQYLVPEEKRVLLVFPAGTKVTSIDTGDTYIGDGVTTGGVLLNVSTGTAAPTDDAEFIGQIFVNTTAKTAYIATDTGTGASDWSQITLV